MSEEGVISGYMNVKIYTMGCGCNKKKQQIAKEATQNKGFINDQIKQSLKGPGPTHMKIPMNSKKGTVGKPELITPEPKSPGLVTKAFNFMKASAEYVKSGMENLNKEDYQVRLKICQDCPFRKDSTCTKCGCFINVKAQWKSADCPDNRWPKQVKE